MSAGFLGWTLDAFDFFVVIFLFDTLAAHFHVPKRDIVLSVTATLMMRPVGALLFGMMADRYGRRRPLMVNVIYFAAIEVLCGFAPNFTVFFILRMLFGIGMGGEWGVGASLAMEHAPVRWRGVLSGILQSGYSIGYLLAALAARVVLPNWGWRAMFWVGGIPALLALYIRTKVPESEAWQQHRVARTIDGPRIAWQHKWLALYMIVLMFLMNCLSHGTQDLYPDFLKHGHGVAPNTVAYITMFYNVGAVVGAIIFGLLSERIGPPLQHAGRAGGCAVGHAGLGVRQHADHSGDRRVRHADGRAGRVGNHSGTSQRALARRRARTAAGIHLSDRNSARVVDADGGVRAARPPGLRLGAGRIRAGGDCRTLADV